MRHECVHRLARERRIAAHQVPHSIDSGGATLLQRSSDVGVDRVTSSPPRTKAETEAKRERRIIGGRLVVIGPRVITRIIGTMAVAIMSVAGVIIVMVATNVTARADIGRPSARLGRLRRTDSRRQQRRGSDRFRPIWTGDKHHHRQNRCTDPFHHRTFSGQSSRRRHAS
jgi:hypothetical protein